MAFDVLRSYDDLDGLIGELIKGRQFYSRLVKIYAFVLRISIVAFVSGAVVDEHSPNLRLLFTGVGSLALVGLIGRLFRALLDWSVIDQIIQSRRLVIGIVLLLHPCLPLHLFEL